VLLVEGGQWAGGGGGGGERRDSYTCVQVKEQFNLHIADNRKIIID
jgi:hypothetical protein